MRTLNFSTDKSESFLHGYLFLAIELVCFFLAWILNAPIISLISTTIFCITIYLLSNDGSLFSNLLFFYLLSVAKLPYFTSIPIELTISLVIYVFFVIAFLIKKIINKTIFPLSFSPLSISMLLFIGCFILEYFVNFSFINTGFNKGFTSLLLLIIFLFVTLFIVLSLVSNKANSSYLKRVFYVFNILIILEVIALALKGDFSFDTGWGTKNVVAIALACCLPFLAAHFADNNKRLDAIALVICDYILIILSNSRGGLYTCLLLIPLLAFILVCKTKNKYSNWFYFLGSLFVLATILYIAIPQIKEQINIMFGKGLELSYRDQIWETSLEYIKPNYFFGKGLDSLFNVPQKFNGPNGEIGISLLHNTFVTLVVSGGFFAVLIYLLQVGESLYCSIKQKGTFGLVLLYFILFSIIHGVFDNTFFSLTFMFPYLIIFARPFDNMKQNKTTS